MADARSGVAGTRPRGVHLQIARGIRSGFRAERPATLATGTREENGVRREMSLPAERYRITGVTGGRG
jgi:hypothetical protein